MADRKVRSITFTVPFSISLKDLKTGVQKEIDSTITVFQDLGAGEYLLEFSSERDTEALIEEGFDVSDAHITCHPPHARVTNVSTMGLRSYIDDGDVKDVLSQYGGIKGEVIRLKYKADHDIAGLENGNRLVKMLLEKKSIPVLIAYWW